MVPMMLLTSLSFMQYARPHDEPGDRTEITLNMVLALVGFKFVVSQMTPAISYFTILDKYTFFCVLLTIFVAFEGGLVGELKRHPQTVDRICMYSTFGVFVIGHVSSPSPCSNGACRRTTTTIHLRTRTSELRAT